MSDANSRQHLRRLVLELLVVGPLQKMLLPPLPELVCTDVLSLAHFAGMLMMILNLHSLGFLVTYSEGLSAVETLASSLSLSPPESEALLALLLTRLFAGR